MPTLMYVAQYLFINSAVKAEKKSKMIQQEQNSFKNKFFRNLIFDGEIRGWNKVELSVVGFCLIFK